MNIKKAGFTLVEMLVVAPIVILAIGAFITLIVNMTGEVISSRASNMLAYDIQDAINRIDEDIRLSTSFLAENNIDLQNGQGIDDGTADFQNVSEENGVVLILNTYVTNGNPTSEDTGLVYLANQPSSCASPDVHQNTPLTMNVVYFIKDSTLWRRSIMPANYDDGSSAVCGTPWQQPSCSPGYDGSSMPFCKTNDIKLVEGVNVNSFSVQYFNSASASNANTVASDEEASTQVRANALLPSTTVNVSILASQKVAGRDVERNASIRSTRPEANASAILPVIAQTAPTVPSGVRAQLKTPGTMTISWHQSNATKYTLQHSTASNFSGATTINDITSTEYDVSNIKGTTLHYFRVRAVNDIGTSGWSSTVSGYSTITAGLTGWWPMNNSPSSIMPISTSVLVGTVTSTTGQNGQANGAYRMLTGASGIKATGLPNTAYTITATGWISPSSYPSERAALFLSWANTSQSAYYMSLANNGSLQMYWYGTSPAGYHSSPASLIPLNQWTFVAVQWTSSQARLFVNGNQVAAVSVTGAGFDNTIMNIGYQDSGGREYRGSMDDFRIYNRALTPQEINQLYQDGAR